MDDYDDESEAYEMLQKTFKQSLYTAKKNSCKSVAIPAISSGTRVCSVSVNSRTTFLVHNLVKLFWGSHLVWLNFFVQKYAQIPMQKSHCFHNSLKKFKINSKNTISRNIPVPQDLHSCCKCSISKLLILVVLYTSF